MKPLLTALLIFCLLTGCSKDPSQTNCEDINEWLEAKKEELSPCDCKKDIYSGSYEQQLVYEIRLVDPLCNGFNSVYTYEGMLLFTSIDKNAFEKYTAAVKNQQLEWSCSEPK